LVKVSLDGGTVLIVAVTPVIVSLACFFSSAVAKVLPLRDFDRKAIFLSIFALSSVEYWHEGGRKPSLQTQKLFPYLSLHFPLPLQSLPLAQERRVLSTLLPLVTSTKAFADSSAYSVLISPLV